MFSDYLNDSQLSCLRQYEKDGLYSPWPMEWQLEPGKEPRVQIFRCWKCGKDLADVTGTDLKAVASMTLKERGKLFPELIVVNLECREYNEVLPVCCCPECYIPISKNEAPQRISFVLASIWARILEETGVSRNLILYRTEEIGDLEIEGDSEFQKEN